MKAALLLLILVFPLCANAAFDIRSVGFEQRLGSQLPLGLELVDEDDARVTLRNYFGRVPVVMLFGYFNCDRLCPEVFVGAAEALRATALRAGRDYEVIAVSIDPDDRAADARHMKAHARFADDAHTHFLRTDANAIAQLTRAAGFHFTRDSNSNGFVHAAGLLIVAPNGAVTQYLFGVRFPEATLRRGLLDAQRGVLASVADRLVLVCAHIETFAGKHSTIVMRVVQAIGLGTMFALLLLWRRRNPV